MKFSGVGLFLHTYEGTDKVNRFEERVVVAVVANADEAEKLILSEFNEYATDGVKFLNQYEINEVYEEEGPVWEVASSMKLFTGSEQEYIDKYWSDQKPVSCESVGWKHSWFNKGNGILGCYNCQKERKGKL